MNYKKRKPGKKSVPRKLPEVITKEEFDKVLAKAKEEREHFRKPRSRRLTPRGIRINQYMIAMILGFGAGMRISEIVGGANVPALLADKVGRNMIRVVSGKGGKDRVVPKPRLFNSEAVKKLPLTIGRRQLQRYVTRLGDEVLQKHVTFHTLRHSFGTHCVEKGMDVSQLQILMGHSRLDTTGKYLHMNPVKAIEKYEEIF